MISDSRGLLFLAHQSAKRHARSPCMSPLYFPCFVVLAFTFAAEDMDSRLTGNRAIVIRTFRILRCVRESFGGSGRTYGKWLRIAGIWCLLVRRVTAIPVESELGSTWTAE